MPPRPRPSDASSQAPATVRPRLASTVSDLFSGEDSDLIIQCANDPTRFAVRRIQLELCSTKFADMFRTSPPGQPAGPGLDNLPVIEIPEDRSTTELFLRHLIPSAYLHEDKAPSFQPVQAFQLGVPGRSSPSQALLLSVLLMAKKYGSPQVVSIICSIQLPLLQKTRSTEAWAFAVICGQLELAQQALRDCLYHAKSDVTSSTCHGAYGTIQPGQRDLCLGDMSADLLSCVPTSAIQTFAILHARVVGTRGPSYTTWKHAANDFRL